METSLTLNEQLAIINDRIHQTDIALFGYKSDYEVGEILEDNDLMELCKKNMIVIQKRKNAFIEIRKRIEQEIKDEEEKQNV